MKGTYGKKTLTMSFYKSLLDISIPLQNLVQYN